MERSKYLDIFIEESREYLQTVNGVLLSLEERGFDEERMNEAFRAVHTIKGSAGTINIGPISELAHVMEDLFDILRKRKEAPERPLIQFLFAGADAIERMLVELERDGSISLSIGDLIDRMKSARDGAAAAPPPRPAARAPGPEDEIEYVELSSLHMAQLIELEASGRRVREIRAAFAPDAVLREGRACQVVRALSALGVIVTAAPAAEGLPDTAPWFTVLIAADRPDEELVSAARSVIGIARVEVVPFGGGPAAGAGGAERGAEEVKAGTSGGGKEKADEAEAGEAGPPALSVGSTIRVRSKLLDRLLDLVGEIMISNIQIDQLAADLKHRELKQNLKNSARLLGELQDIVLRMRMVQMDFIFKRFPRIVRDMARDHGKEIEFVMKGNDIEIDRGLLDEIGDALVHLLRNAVDHGIEPKEDRIAAGKNQQGTVALSAYQEQGSIMIAVEDDGRGMDIGEITAKALAKGLITSEDAEKMDRRAKLQLVLLPGFSTSEKVTDISGRGVGMDVVKTKIEGLGGNVRIDTVPGKGTKVTLRLPPSMSIIRAMLVEVNAEKYAIPLENVRETVRVPRGNVHEVAGKAVFQLRSEVLSVLNVHTLFGGEAEKMPDVLPAIIVEKNGGRACLVVSRLIGQQEIVVKSLGKDLRQTGYFSGATVLGDGKVALILDVGAFV